jgi:hypothetical protein
MIPNHKAQGPFDLQMTAEPPFDVVEGVALARTRFDKRFHGPLDATSTVQMLSARTQDPKTAAYVAIERVVGILEGQQGSFVLLHLGLSTPEKRSLLCTIGPGSGTGELKGISGEMKIEIREGGAHFYELTYTLPV